jgi:hypothetical protein
MRNLECDERFQVSEEYIYILQEWEGNNERLSLLQRPAHCPDPVPAVQAGGRKGDTVGIARCGFGSVPQTFEGQ